MNNVRFAWGLVFHKRFKKIFTGSTPYARSEFRKLWVKTLKASIKLTLVEILKAHILPFKR